MKFVSELRSCEAKSDFEHIMTLSPTPNVEMKKEVGGNTGLCSSSTQNKLGNIPKDELLTSATAMVPSFSRPVVLTCCICEEVVRDVVYVCSLCGHGGHRGHMETWFGLHMLCPTGCNCACTSHDPGVVTIDGESGFYGLGEVGGKRREFLEDFVYDFQALSVNQSNAAVFVT